MVLAHGPWTRLLTLLALASGCTPHVEPSPRSGPIDLPRASRDAGSAAEPSHADAGVAAEGGARVASRVACTLSPAKTVEIPARQASYRATALEAFGLAAQPGSALVTAQVSMTADCEHDGCIGGVELGAAWLSTSAAAAWTVLPSSATGINGAKVAAPAAWRGELVAVTVGAHGNGPMDMKQAPNEPWMIQASGKLTKSASRPFTATALTAPGDGTVLFGTGSELPWTAMMTDEARQTASVRSFLVDPTRRYPSEVLHQGPPAPQGQWPAEAPTNAVAARGDKRMAVAFLVKNDLHVVEVDPATGKATGAPRVVDRRANGAPALAFAGDVLHVLWRSTRSTTQGDSTVLMHAVTDGREDSGAARVEELPGAHDMREAPAFATRGGTWLTVRVRRDEVLFGASDVGLFDAVADARPVSSLPAKARQARLVWPARGDAWLAWWEQTEKGTLAVRYATVACAPK